MPALLTDHHVDQVDIVADLGDGRPRNIGVERRGDRLRTQTELLHLLLVDANPQFPFRFHPVEVDAQRTRMIRHDIPQLQGDVAQLGWIRAHDAILHRPTHRRAEFERRDAPDHFGKLFQEQAFQTRLQALAGIDVLRYDHRLSEEGIGQLNVEGQIEADRALTDIGAPAFDFRREVGIVPQKLLEAVHETFGRMDRGVLR